MVKQVQVVAILMIVNGALVSLAGLLYAFMGPAMFVAMSIPPPSKSSTSPPDTVVMTVMSVFYVALGLLVLAVGILNIVAGVRSLKFRGRIFAIVALFSNLVPVFTCYCMPTSIGLMIYGLIVFFQPDVARAFAMVAVGVPPERFKRGWRGDEEDIDDESDPRQQREPTHPPDNIQLGPSENVRKTPPGD